MSSDPRSKHSRRDGTTWICVLPDEETYRELEGSFVMPVPDSVDPEKILEWIKKKEHMILRIDLEMLVVYAREKGVLPDMVLEKLQEEKHNVSPVDDSTIIHL